MAASIPPRIRALAKVIHDNDLSMFPSILVSDGDTELADASNARRKSLKRGSGGFMATKSELSQFRRGPLDALLQKLQDDTALSDDERKMFERAFEEYSQHLRVVDLDTLRLSRFAPALTLTLAIDNESTFAGISLGDVLPSVIRVHDFCLKFAHHECVPTMTVYLTTLTEVVCDALRSIYSVVAESAQTRVGAKAGVLTLATKNVLVDLNAILAIHALHLEWLVHCTLTSAGVNGFDAHDHLTDLSIRETWSASVGRGIPLCRTSTFAQALTMFPPWAQSCMLSVLDIHQSGVISVFSIQRLLALWGPYLLIHRNMQRDIATKIFSLELTSEAAEQFLREQGEPGDTVATLSNSIGCVNITVMTPSRNVQTIVADRSSGAWILHGVSVEDFATIGDAVGQFPQLFARCRGATVLQETEVGELEETSSSTVCDDVFSIFHRACFHNNIQYVKTLIERGAAVLVNTAVADPLIASRFSWTPLLCCVNNPNGDPEEVVDALIRTGADVTIRDEANCTALYYAIANGYSKAVRRLLTSSPTLETSQTTRPLMACLGAHHFNMSDLDNHRLTDTVPSPFVVTEVLRNVRNWSLVKLAIAIVESKLEDRLLTPSDIRIESTTWIIPGVTVPLLTLREVALNERAIQQHGALCRQHRLELTHVLRLLRMHAFKLSCHSEFGIPLEK